MQPECRWVQLRTARDASLAEHGGAWCRVTRNELAFTTTTTKHNHTAAGVGRAPQGLDPPSEYVHGTHLGARIVGPGNCPL